MKLSNIGSLLLGVGLLCSSPALEAATNPNILPLGVARTNTLPTPRRVTSAPAAPAATDSKTNSKPSVPTHQAATSSAAGKAASFKASAIRLWSSVVDGLRRWKASSFFYPVLIGLGLGGLLLYQFVQSKTKTAAGPSTKINGKAPKSGGAPITSCNVLQSSLPARTLWKFDSRGGAFALSREQTCPEGDSLPTGLVAKDWRSLWQQKLNIAWFPVDQVFLRVAQFPLSDFDETLAMVELQLEKLSPMPVAQIVWSMHLLPHPKGNQQTVILAIVARSAVEEFLGKLEGQGYLADRLELPVFDVLQATPITEDGAWIYPAESGPNQTALVAWWYGGVLHNLDLISLPALNAPQSLKEQLLQMAWAGEMDGWVTRPPTWHLVAEPPVAAEWEPALREGLEQPIEVNAPLPALQVAELTARRSASADVRANLLPVEFSTRYREQFYDRLWMGALLGVGALYLAGVLVYGIALGVATYRTRAVEAEVAALSNSYTNAIQLKARFNVLKERQNLKFAALDCWNAVAKTLPASLTLESCAFSEGKTLVLNGTAPNDAAQEILNFDDVLRKTSKDRDDQALFDPTKGDHANWRTGPGGVLNWNMRLELNHGEAE